MKEINYEWLKRVKATHDKLDRTVPLNSPTTRCTRQILIDRYFKFLMNRTFKIKIPNEYSGGTVYYAMFMRTEHNVTCTGRGDGEKYYSYGVQKYNGWSNSEFTISFRDEKLEYQKFTLHWNDILKITYEEIPLFKYLEVAKLFISSSDEHPHPNYDHCKYFDEAQGRFLCTSKDVKSKKCGGVDCGVYEETRK